MISVCARLVEIIKERNGEFEDINEHLGPGH